MLGDRAAAAQAEKEAQGAALDDVLDHFLMADELYRREKFGEAIKEFDQVLERKPGHFWAQYLNAICLLRQGRPAEARTLLSACLADALRFCLALSAAGLRSRGAASVGAADSDFQKASQLPLDDNAHYVLSVNRGVLRVRQERFEDAVTDLKSAIERKPKAYQAYVNLAQAYRRLGKMDLALEQLDRAVELEPGLAHLYRLRARLRLERNEPALALSDFDQAIERENTNSPYQVDDHVERGRLLLSGGKYAEALDSFDAALALQKDHSLGQRLRAETLFRLGRFDEVIKAFDRYLETGKPQESVYRGRGLARAELGQYPGAIEDFTKALELHPTSAVQAYRGWTHLVVDAPKLALRDFELAIELDSNNGDAYNGRGFVRASLGRHREAIQDAEEALRHGPTSPRLLYNAARIYAQCPDPYRAARTGVDRAGFELAPRRPASGLLVHAYSNGCGSGRAPTLSSVRQTGLRVFPQEVIHALFEGESRACVVNRAASRPSGCWTGIGSNIAPCLPPRPWRRPSLCTSALSTMLKCRTSCPFRTSSTSTPSTLQEGETLDASIDAQDAGSALTSLLRVFNANGTPLALDNQLGGDPQLTFQASTAGTYYIGVSSAPNDDYNPTVMYSGVPGATTGLYTLSVTLTTSAPLMPDLTGSSFRTGVDMAAAGDTIPVNFTVQNRGGADPGNFQVQVLLSDSNIFPSSSRVLATFTRGELVTDATGRDFSSPAGFSVTLPAGQPSGPAYLGLRIVADPNVPEAGLYDKSGVHRGSDWEPLTVVTRAGAGATDLSNVDRGLYTEITGSLGSGQVNTWSFTVSSTLGNGELKAEVAATSGTLQPRLTLSGPTGAVADPVGQRRDRPVVATGDILSDRLGAGGGGRLPAHHGVHPDQSAVRPARLRSGHRLGGCGGLERRRHPRHRHGQPD